MGERIRTERGGWRERWWSTVRYVFKFLRYHTTGGVVCFMHEIDMVRLSSPAGGGDIDWACFFFQFLSNFSQRVLLPSPLSRTPLTCHPLSPPPSFITTNTHQKHHTNTQKKGTMTPPVFTRTDSMKKAQEKIAQQGVCLRFNGLLG